MAPVPLGIGAELFKNGGVKLRHVDNSASGPTSRPTRAPPAHNSSSGHKAPPPPPPQSSKPTSATQPYSSVTPRPFRPLSTCGAPSAPAPSGPPPAPPPLRPRPPSACFPRQNSTTDGFCASIPAGWTPSQPVPRSPSQSNVSAPPLPPPLAERRLSGTAPARAPPPLPRNKPVGPPGKHQAPPPPLPSRNRAASVSSVPASAAPPFQAPPPPPAPTYNRHSSFEDRPQPPPPPRVRPAPPLPASRPPSHLASSLERRFQFRALELFPEPQMPRVPTQKVYPSERTNRGFVPMVPSRLPR